MLALTTAKYLGKLSGLDEWLMASLGASALLVFALPGSPMVQPWAVIAGNTLSALEGIATIHLVNEHLLVIPMAASLSIFRNVSIALLASTCRRSIFNCGARACHAL